MVTHHYTINNYIKQEFQDVILMVNLILDNEYNLSGDFNSDDMIDILDVVQLVDLILE